ncbi:unnamed protein product [Didymodactylos carnosus]|nr:unnamed protein product [Didymodactylos carnosus]
MRRPVAHNLPCFTINFTDKIRKLSVVYITEQLYDYFKKQNVKLIGKFILARYAGQQFKIRVGNKEDYFALLAEKVWPTTINGIDIKVSTPNFVPEQFTLVVRYVPQTFSIKQVEDEVKLSAKSAANFRRIVYSYERSTHDYRFTVSDLNEHKGLLALERIGIGNLIRPITQYLPANKLTYCTKRWKIGHTKDQCDQSIFRCKICLQELNPNHNEVYNKQPSYAQCGLNHQSLNPVCAVIQQYRSDLNNAVKKALYDGVLKRPELQQQMQQKQPGFILNKDDFPVLNLTKNNRNSLQQEGSHPNDDLSNSQLFTQLKDIFELKFEKQMGEIQQISSTS